MKTLYTTLILALAFGLSATSALAQSTLQNTSFTASALNNQIIPLNIYLPDGYATAGKEYPLYIFLHGCCGNAPSSHTTLFKARLDALIGSGDVEPMIMAFPSIQGADYGNRHIFMNSVRNGDYGDAITVDLMDFMNANYRISKDARLRAIGGFSMGGDGAWRLGVVNPDSFGTVLSHGAFPALDPFPALIAPSFLQENGGSAPYTFSPSAGAFSAITFGLSSTWSPNLLNSPYMLDLPVKTDGTLDTALFQSWYSVADVSTMIRERTPNPSAIAQCYYFDVGTQVGLLFPSNQLLDKQFDTMKTEGYSFSVKYIAFNAGHAVSQARVDSSLTWLSKRYLSTILNRDQELYSLKASIFVSQQSLLLDIPDVVNGKEVMIQISGIDGKTLYRKRNQPSTRISIPISGLSKGVYFIRIKHNGHLKTLKFMI
ncbi:MAG: alpha/beta hydrolase-fold protein [Bacteroidia bacterium]